MDGVTSRSTAPDAAAVLTALDARSRSRWSSWWSCWRSVRRAACAGCDRPLAARRRTVAFVARAGRCCSGRPAGSREVYARLAVLGVDGADAGPVAGRADRAAGRPPAAAGPRRGRPAAAASTACCVAARRASSPTRWSGRRSSRCCPSCCSSGRCRGWAIRSPPVGWLLQLAAGGRRRADGAAAGRPRRRRQLAGRRAVAGDRVVRAGARRAARHRAAPAHPPGRRPTSTTVDVTRGRPAPLHDQQIARRACCGASPS